MKGMLKNGLATLLIGFLVFGATPTPTAASQLDCARVASDGCCGACHCPVKGYDSCVACVQEKTNLAVVTMQMAAKPRVSLALYFLPESKSAEGRPFFSRSIPGLDPSPPSGGSFRQALLRLWLI